MTASSNVDKQNRRQGFSALNDGEFRFGAAGTSTPFLAGGLSELLVFELTATGDHRRYMHMHVRGLYRYVLQAITTRLDDENADETDDHHDHASSAKKRRDSQLHNNKRHPAADETKVVLERSKLQRNISVDPRYYTQHENPATQQQQQPQQPVTYRERLGGYLHPRDMRRLVTPFSASNEPELIVRRHVMLLNFDPLRAIVLRDRLLVLVPTGADSILVQIEERVRQGNNENSIFNWGQGSSDDPTSSQHSLPLVGATTPEAEESSHPLNKFLRKVSFTKHNQPNDDKEAYTQSTKPTGKDNSNDDGNSNDDDMEEEWEEMARRDWIHLPFELQCAEAVLHVVSTILIEDTEELKAQCDEYMRRVLEFSPRDDPLMILRIVKDAIHLMTNRIKAFNQSLNRLLSDEEDMALMNLSRLLTHPERFIQPVPQQILDEESDEPELILESSLQIGLTLLNSMQLLQGQVTNAKELVDQKQDATRNQLLFANMLLSVFSLCTALAAMIGSFFGMNVPIPMSKQVGEDDKHFYRITFGSAGAAISLCFFIMAVLWFTGTIPRTVKVPKTKGLWIGP